MDKESLERLHSCLVRARDKGRPLSIRVAGSDDVFHSELIDVGPPACPSWLTLKPLDPDHGNAILSCSPSLTISFAEESTAGENNRCAVKAVFLQREELPSGCVVKVTFPDKRRQLRIEPSAREPVLVMYEAGGNQVDVVANISTGGIGFYTNTDDSVLAFGAQMPVSLVLPKEDPIFCTATVRWLWPVTDKAGARPSSPYRFYCGMELKPDAAGDADRIAQYIKYREREIVRTCLQT
jgi:hypothetical protein